MVVGRIAAHRNQPPHKYNVADTRLFILAFVVDGGHRQNSFHPFRSACDSGHTQYTQHNKAYIKLNIDDIFFLFWDDQ